MARDRTTGQAAAAQKGHNATAKTKAKIPTVVLSKKDKAEEDRVIAACKRGELSELKALLAGGRAITPQILQEACRNGHLAIVKALVEAGADIEANSESGSALITTIWADKLKVFQYLLAIGANVDAKHARREISAFALAAHEGRLEMMEILVKHGADFLVDSPLKHAKYRIDIIQFLLDLGCDPLDATHYGGTILHAAASDGRPRLVKLLLDRGYDVDALDNRGWTPLHQACYTPENAMDKIALLLSRGAKDALAVESKAGYCPLHLLLLKGDETLAQARKSSTTAHVKLLLDAGADASAKCRSGRSALNLAVFENDEPSTDVLELLRLMCSHGATWDASCEQSLQSALTATATPAQTKEPKSKKMTKEQAKILKNLTFCGTEDSPVGGKEQERDPAECTSHTVRTWLTGVRVCVQQWERDVLEKGGDAPLTQIPIEVVELGDKSVRLYLSDSKSSSASQKISRSKICVVGPSEWGKTSLVKSVTTLQPSLVHIADRTIGIDLFPCAFTRDHDQDEPVATSEEEQALTANHEVTFWDFAGQDVYHVAHALFFSKRTLYLLCIDLPQYLAQLDNPQNLSMRDHEREMRKFVDHHVLKWVETIVVRQPDAEFLVVGTKCDLVQDKSQIDAVWLDLKARQHSWRERFAENATASIYTGSSTAVSSSSSPQAQGQGQRAGGAGSHAAETFRLQEITAKLERAFRDSWIVVSSVDQASVELARRAMESNVVAASKGFVMGNKYNNVVRAIARRRALASQSGDAKTRVESLILPVKYLCRELLREIEDLEVDDCALILRTLHELGDVLWYDHHGAEALRDCVILDPLLVIDLVKEVISHEHQSSGGTDKNDDALWKALRDEGRMSHELLRTGALWRHLDEELTQAFKSLLKYFKLAYSAEGDAMDWDSDLIVPAYWKIKSIDVSATSEEQNLQEPSLHHEMSILQFGKQEQDGAVGATTKPTAAIAWEYGVSAGVASTVFDHFAVQSYSAQVQRTISAHAIECRADGEFASRIVLLSDGSATRDVIRIDVAAMDAPTAWRNLKYFVMMMEKVLDEYPGLLVSRDILHVATGSGHETRHRVAEIVQKVEDATYLGRDVAALVSKTWPWLACDLSWFIEKAWRHPGLLQEIESRAVVQQQWSDKTAVLRKLIARGTRGRLLPALWTAKCDASMGKLVLEMRSDLSGKCFHEPLEISVPANVLATHGVGMETGLWVCSNVAPELLTLGVIQRVIDTAAPLLSGRIERVHAVYNLINNLELEPSGRGGASGFLSDAQSASRLSPSGTRALLRELLKLHDASFDELRISELANLQCAVSGGGSYVWADRHEIKAMGDKLVPCEPDYHAHASPTSNSSSLAATSSLLSQKALRLTLTFERLQGLSSWDSYKVLCAWQLLHPSNPTAPLATGTTEPLTSESSSVSWHDRPFVLVQCVASIAMLRECRLRVEVKRASRFLGTLKLLGEGTVALAGFVPAFREPGAAIATPIVVPLEANGASSSRVVTCTITTSRVGAAG